MLIAVTGANGFVGRRVVSRLARDGHSVRALSRKEMTDLPPGAQWLAAPDLGPQADWGAAMRGVDAVVHAAARVHVMRDSGTDAEEKYIETNVLGTRALASAAAAAGVKRFIFISSIKASGEATPRDRPFTPDDHPRPEDAYGRSKLAAERAIQEIAQESGMSAASIRPVVVFGPGNKGNFAAMARAIGRGLPLPLGAIDNRRSLVFVDNLADLVATAILHNGPLPPVLLVKDSTDFSTPGLLRAVGTAMGRRPRIISVPPALLNGLARAAGRAGIADRLLGSLTVDDSATRALLDWTPPYTTEAGLKETFATAE